jgi:predicted nucleic acid-binding protein
MRLVLDTGILGQVVHPRRYDDVRAWLARAVAVHEILISEVCDYELRRELLRIGARRSLDRLDELGRELRYLPATTATWRSAAALWAMARRAGRPTADRESLDADVLVAAQARAEDAVVVTTNPRHFELFTEAAELADVELEPDAE